MARGLMTFCAMALFCGAAMAARVTMHTHDSDDVQNEQKAQGSTCCCSATEKTCKDLGRKEGKDISVGSGTRCCKVRADGCDATGGKYSEILSGMKEGTCLPVEKPPTTTAAPTTTEAVTIPDSAPVVEELPKTKDLTELFAGSKFVTVGDAKYKCCCMQVEAAIACSVKETTGGCGAFGPGVHSWNNMGAKYADVPGYDACVVSSDDPLLGALDASSSSELQKTITTDTVTTTDVWRTGTNEKTISITSTLKEHGGSVMVGNDKYHCCCAELYPGLQYPSISCQMHTLSTSGCSQFNFKWGMGETIPVFEFNEMPSRYADDPGYGECNVAVSEPLLKPLGLSPGSGP